MDVAEDALEIGSGPERGGNRAAQGLREGPLQQLQGVSQAFGGDAHPVGGLEVTALQDRALLGKELGYQRAQDPSGLGLGRCHDAAAGRAGRHQPDETRQIGFQELADPVEHAGESFHPQGAERPASVTEGGPGGGVAPRPLQAQVAEEDVGIADHAEAPSQPPSLAAQLQAGGFGQARADNSKSGPQAAGADARLVDSFDAVVSLRQASAPLEHGLEAADDCRERRRERGGGRPGGTTIGGAGPRSARRRPTSPRCHTRGRPHMADDSMCRRPAGHDHRLLAVLWCAIITHRPVHGAPLPWLLGGCSRGGTPLGGPGFRCHRFIGRSIAPWRSKTRR